MQNLITQIKTLAAHIAAFKDNRTVHLNAAQGQCLAAADSLSLHVATLQSLAKQAEDEIKNLGAVTEARLQNLESLKTAATAAADSNRPAND